MKSNVTYQFQQDDGTQLNACGYLEGIILEQTKPAMWDPSEEKPTEGERHTINMTVEDARELAANLNRAADFVDEYRANLPKVGRR